MSLPILMFILGFLSHVLRHNLRLPGEVYKAISMYLLFAIGLKGGMAMKAVTFWGFLPKTLASIGAGVLIPIWVYLICKCILGLNRFDSGALAAHYGSVSAVTYVAVVKLLEGKSLHIMGGFPIILTLMEIPGIVVGLTLAKRNQELPVFRVILNVVSSQSILLLLGGLLVGSLATPVSLNQTSILFQDLFYSILGFFLLDMGVSTAQKLSHFQQIGWKLAIFGILVPLMNSIIGITIGILCGFDLAATTVFATLCASASYIAAPAAVKYALPEANPGYYLTCAMAITFPFNLTVGIPLYYELSKWIFEFYKISF